MKVLVMVEQGAVSLDGQKIADANLELVPKDGAVLKIGKRHFFKIRC